MRPNLNLRIVLTKLFYFLQRKNKGRMIHEHLNINMNIYCDK
jgi:hypothetical protein